ncbi:hypothetical protein ADL12_31265 [Streptomyces regalis]|uniref:Uncharacterized protein n=1 Tax=Streptomyces regalis TaxID=68262 RepID=A0A101JHM5_9ACTN|nr:hypothetical protein ADL12_31265 [Streptomyces regalis]
MVTVDLELVTVVEDQGTNDGLTHPVVLRDHRTGRVHPVRQQPQFPTRSRTSVRCAIRLRSVGDSRSTPSMASLLSFHCAKTFGHVPLA